jgi:outer membrane lipoprotein carrier protein
MKLIEIILCPYKFKTFEEAEEHKMKVIVEAAKKELKKREEKMIKLFLLMILSLSINIPAQDAEQRLKDLQNKFEEINDLTVDIVQKSGGAEVLSGKLSFKKENKFYLDLKNNLIISDGNNIWNYNKKENKVIINIVDESDPSYFSFNTFVYEYPSQCDLSLKDGDIILTPKPDSELNFMNARLILNEENLVEKVLIKGAGADIEISFSNYQLNQKTADTKFKFIPPEGSSVIDLR